MSEFGIFVSVSIIATLLFRLLTVAVLVALLVLIVCHLRNGK